jgi:hypothetical protein
MRLQRQASILVEPGGAKPTITRLHRAAISSYSNPDVEIIYLLPAYVLRETLGTYARRHADSGISRLLQAAWFSCMGGVAVYAHS